MWLTIASKIQEALRCFNNESTIFSWSRPIFLGIISQDPFEWSMNLCFGFSKYLVRLLGLPKSDSGGWGIQAGLLDSPRYNRGCLEFPGRTPGVDEDPSGCSKQPSSAPGVSKRRGGTPRLRLFPSSHCAVVTVPRTQQSPCISTTPPSRSLQLPPNYSYLVTKSSPANITLLWISPLTKYY